MNYFIIIGIIIQFLLIIHTSYLIITKKYEKNIEKKSIKELLKTLYLYKYIIVSIIIGGFIILPLTLFIVILFIKNEMLYKFIFLFVLTSILSTLTLGYFIHMKTSIKAEMKSREIENQRKSTCDLDNPKINEKRNFSKMDINVDNFGCNILLFSG